MIDDAVLDSAYLDRVFHDAGLDAERRKLRQFDRNSIVMMAGEQVDDLPVGMSKLGGDPDLPESVEWPQGGDGAPLALVAQVNLAGTRPFDLVGELPDSGFLWVFYDVSKQPWGFTPEEQEYHRVIWSPCDVDAVRCRTRPTDDRKLDEWDQQPEDIRQRPLSFASRTETAHGWSPLTDRAGLTPGEKDAWLHNAPWSDDYFPSSHRRNPDDVPLDGPHKLLGHSDNQQMGMELDCALVHRGLKAGTVATPENGPSAEVLAAADEDVPHWRLLMQVETQLPMWWGNDGGAVYVWIRDDDLAQRRFDRTMLFVQCS